MQRYKELLKYASFLMFFFRLLTLYNNKRRLFTDVNTKIPTTTLLYSDGANIPKGILLSNCLSYLVNYSQTKDLRVLRHIL